MSLLSFKFYLSILATETATANAPEAEAESAAAQNTTIASEIVDSSSASEHNRHPNTATILSNVEKHQQKNLIKIENSKMSKNGYIRRVFIIFLLLVITTLVSSLSYSRINHIETQVPVQKRCQYFPGLTFCSVLDRMENTGGTMWLENKLGEENWVPPQISNILRYFDELLFHVDDLLISVENIESVVSSFETLNPGIQIRILLSMLHLGTGLCFALLIW